MVTSEHPRPRTKALLDSHISFQPNDFNGLRTHRVGRPPIPTGERKRRVNLMLDPDVIAELKAKGNMSAEANQIPRDKPGL